MMLNSRGGMGANYCTQIQAQETSNYDSRQAATSHLRTFCPLSNWMTWYLPAICHTVATGGELTTSTGCPFITFALLTENSNLKARCVRVSSI